MGTGRRRGLIAVAVGLALVAVLWLRRGLPPPTPNPPGTFAFAALGDAPYYAWEDAQYPLALRDIDAHDLRFVLHVGDIFWRPCSDERYQRSLAWFNGLRHPVVYIPGDNEWTDCWERGSGAYAPLERLRRLRQIFFADPAHSVGGKRLALATQAGEFVEHARWAQEGLVFATVHLVGSGNARHGFPGRTAADDEAVTRRTEAATAWLRATFAEARATQASAVVVGFHADPSFEAPTDDPYRQDFEPFLAALEEEVEAFGKPVLVVHGDSHHYVVDHPLRRRTTGQRLERFTRLEVPGSPKVGWVRVVVRPGSGDPFSFERHVLPRWKYF
jgi:hypothetical protein